MNLDNIVPLATFWAHLITGCQASWAILVVLCLLGHAPLQSQAVSGPLPACFWQFPDLQHPQWFVYCMHETTHKY